MLRPGRRRIYWDSCVWLDYISETPENKEVLDMLLRDSAMRSGNIHLITSVIAITEVAFGATEKANQALDDDVEQKIDSLWKDTTAVTLVEPYPAIALRARGIIRLGIEKGWTGLRALDAIHLATAQQIEADEFHTYDTQLHRYSEQLGFPITAPYVHGPPSSEDKPRLL
ncbi:MAG: type II toxin-antitoxin system VapC family toxin [Chloroflexi bacterium]|nr:type II toxin-antitoxin system VapC family toxin [Chloroflexota bacterium]